jgi:hypothetical protein
VTINNNSYVPYCFYKILVYTCIHGCTYGHLGVQPWGRWRLLHIHIMFKMILLVKFRCNKYWWNEFAIRIRHIFSVPATCLDVERYTADTVWCCPYRIMRVFHRRVDMRVNYGHKLWRWTWWWVRKKCITIFD